MEKTDKKKQGKRNKVRGALFELKVRADLESKGWIVAKWMNNVELSIIVKGIPTIEGIEKLRMQKTEDVKIEIKNNEELHGQLIPAKRKYNPFNRALAIGTGFPDFIAFKIASGYMSKFYEVIGVECKGGDDKHKYLSKEEKEKALWYLRNNKFSEILIANRKKVGRKVEVEYVEFKDG